MSVSWDILVGDCRKVLAGLAERSVHTCVTSPPFYGLRDYGTGKWVGGDAACVHAPTGGRGSYAKPNGASLYQGDGLRGAANRAHVVGAPHRGGRPTECRCGSVRVDEQIGLEPTPAEFVDALVEVFREVRRVLRDDGTVWLNLGDSYSGAPVGSFNGGGFKDKSALTGGRDLSGHAQAGQANKANLPGVKQKDLIGVPWLAAFALRADGWYLRSDIIWSKPNPMPESVTDRPTRAHEYVFLLSKRARYYYDAAAIREDFADERMGRDGSQLESERNRGGRQDGYTKPNGIDPSANGGRNKRSVWEVSPQPYAGAHFATFPPKLILPCVLAGCPEGGTVLDPFAGAGTTGVVALRNDRSFVGVELNADYAELARNRIRDDAPLFNTMSEGLPC